MTRIMLILVAALLASPSLLAQSPQPTSPAQEPHDVSYCQLAADPVAYNHELIRVTAFITHGFEDFLIADPACQPPKYHFSIWVEYGGRTQSGTIYCCPGEGGKELRDQELTVEGVKIPLLTNLIFQGFTNLLKAEPDTTMHATLVGRFFSGEKQTIRDSTYWRGYGHLGCCSLFVIQRVESFDSHTRKDLDYSAEAGWYESEGCDAQSVRWLRSVSVSDEAEPLEEAISEQRLADGGARAWAFSQPKRVAIESLKPFYPDQVSDLRIVKRTAARQVFRWKKGKRRVTIVVTRPYWLSFYAKSTSVVWVATMIKEAECP